MGRVVFLCALPINDTHVCIHLYIYFSRNTLGKLCYGSSAYVCLYMNAYYAEMRKIIKIKVMCMK